MKYILLLFVCVYYCLALPSKYHTSAQLNQQLNELSTSCSFIQLKNASDEPLIKEININKGMGKKYRGFLLFGEHPRELISPESGLHFLQDLCNDKEDRKNQQILENFELRMILNANPLSRQKVEEGSYCLRENENGVDLNRNYDAHWQKIQDDVKQITSGPHAFSEVETQTIRNSLKDFNADIFLSIHSGTLGMYTPHAYSQEDAEVNEDQMVDVLKDLQNKYCPSCDVGAAGEAVGYLSPGSCIDFAYDELKIRYSFAFEIYHGSINLERELTEREINLIQLSSNNKQPKKQKKQKSSCFLQTSSKTKDMDADQCFEYFNPDSNQYDWYVQNWTEAYQEMLVKMIAEEQQTK